MYPHKEGSRAPVRCGTPREGLEVLDEGPSPKLNVFEPIPPSYYEVVDLLTARLDDRRSLAAHDWDSEESDDEETLN